MTERMTERMTDRQTRKVKIRVAKAERSRTNMAMAGVDNRRQLSIGGLTAQVVLFGLTVKRHCASFIK